MNFQRTIAALHAGTAAEPLSHELKRFGELLLKEERERGDNGILPAERELLDRLR